MEIILPSTNRSWLDHDDVLGCRADSNPPATYHWTWAVQTPSTGRGHHGLTTGDQFLLDVCSMFNETERRHRLSARHRVMLRCVATQLDHNATASVVINVSTSALDDDTCGGNSRSDCRSLRLTNSLRPTYLLSGHNTN